MTAAEAFKLGLVNRLVFPDDLQAEPLAIAEEFVAKPANALTAVKNGIVASFGPLSTYFDEVGTGFDDPKLFGRLYSESQE